MSDKPVFNLNDHIVRLLMDERSASLSSYRQDRSVFQPLVFVSIPIVLSLSFSTTQNLAPRLNQSACYA